MPHTSRAALLSLLAAAALLLTACATPSSGEYPGPGGGTNDPVAPVDVVAQGTVIQVGDAAPELCLGALAESYPPQCSGPQLIGWDWALYDGSESSGDTTWGTYAVFGSWDRTVLTVTGAIQLALYDPLPIEDPLLEEANAGSSTAQQLTAIQNEIGEASPVEILQSVQQNGYLFITVEFDDGSVQRWADETYGPEVVAVRSALRSLARG